MSLSLLFLWVFCCYVYAAKFAKVSLKTESGELYKSKRAGWFYMETIKCSENMQDCYVVCESYRSCISNIICNNNQQCSIKCDARESCIDQTTITSENNKVLRMHCNGDNSCSNGLKIEISNITDIVNIECNGIESCSNIDLFEIKAILYTSKKDIIIECNGKNSCFNITYNLAKILNSNELQLKIVCNGDGSCIDNNINVLFTNKLQFICKDNCYNVKINRNYNKYDNNFILDVQCDLDTDIYCFQIDIDEFEANDRCYGRIRYNHKNNLYSLC